MSNIENFSEEIVKVDKNCPIYEYIYGVNSKGLKTLISKKDGNIPYPNYYFKKWEAFGYRRPYFLVTSKDGLKFLISQKFGIILNIPVTTEELEDYERTRGKNVREFFENHWDTFNMMFYLYTDEDDDGNIISTLVKRDDLSIVYPETWFTEWKDFGNPNFFAVTIMTDNGYKNNLLSRATGEFVFKNHVNDLWYLTPDLLLIGDKGENLSLTHLSCDGKISYPLGKDYRLHLNDVVVLDNGKLLINKDNEVLIY